MCLKFLKCPGSGSVYRIDHAKQASFVFHQFPQLRLPVKGVIATRRSRRTGPVPGDWGAVPIVTNLPGNNALAVEFDNAKDITLDQLGDLFAKNVVQSSSLIRPPPDWSLFPHAQTSALG